MEPMTLWQFYVVFAVQFVLGVGLCWAMLKLGARCPILGRQKDGWSQKLRDKLMVGFIVLAAIASYQTLPDIVNSFTNDFSTAVAESTVDLGERAIKGEDISDDLNFIRDVNEATTGVIWGEANASQWSSLMLMTGFWFCLAWCCFVGNYASSPSSWWQKVLKCLAYPMLTAVILYWPIQLHTFSFDELKPGLILLVGAALLIAASHDYSPAPPELPSVAGGGLVTTPPPIPEE